MLMRERLFFKFCVLLTISKLYHTFYHNCAGQAFQTLRHNGSINFSWVYCLNQKTFRLSLQNIMAINIFLIMLLFYLTFARITDNMDTDKEFTDSPLNCLIDLSLFVKSGAGQISYDCYVFINTLISLLSTVFLIIVYPT